MPWFQVDDDFPTHPGVLATSLAARGLWATAGAWCSKRLTDVVPSHVLVSFGSTPELVAELVTAKVWTRTRGGYRFTQQSLCKIPDKGTVDNQRRMKTNRQNRWREGQRRRAVDASTGHLQDRLPGSITNTSKELPPNPPQAGGHRGQHPNCRACGTSPRGRPPEPPATPMPPPVEDVIAVNGRPLRGAPVKAIADQARQAMSRCEPEPEGPP